MTKKLRMTSKQKLTTLAVLSVVAGVGLRVDTAHADTVDSSNDTATNNRGTSVSADEMALKSVPTSGAQAQQLGTTRDTSIKDATSKESDTKESKVTGDTSKTTVPSALADETAPKTIAKDKTDVDSQINSGEKEATLHPQKSARIGLLRDSTPTIKASGTSGTSHWTEDTDGVVTVTGGNLDKMKTLANATKLIFDGSLGKIVLPANSDYFFQFWTNLTEIDGWENVDASNVTSMANMFSSDVSLKSLDLSALDLSHVTDMSNMVSGGIYDGTGSHPMSITRFKLGSSTNRVTDMTMMLFGDDSLVDVDAENWDVSNLLSAESLFDGTAIAHLDLSNWQTSKLQSLSGTFANMSNLTTLNVAGLQTGSVTNFVETFENDPLLTTVDVSKWDVSSSPYFTSMFYGDSSLKNLDLSHWHPDALLQMNRMFSGDASLTSLNLSGFDTISGGRGTSAVNEALLGTIGLHEIVLGPNTSLGDATQNAKLPDIPVTNTYTGLWQAVGTGTVNKPNGATYTSAQLNASYDGATMADTYVWQQVSTTPTDPGTSPDTDTDGDNGTVIGDGNEDEKGTPDKSQQKKPILQKPTMIKLLTTAKRDKMDVFSANQGATMMQKTGRQRTMTVTDHQSEKATLPQTNEKKSSLWAAIGAVTLGILSFHWYKRQD
ncbi:BspA family leucine-rich repeat surface protein [Levilactobacillus huananensis]|uniref:BspA family leucine-rich repeat surface protein n=1 Tax=Levilactobacillus huananensis TaxID=2486019 RepID=UPI0013DE304E|nr:BspA family leucine-rich repeat surface protein [Levilactobacillus huananensis]